MSLITQGRIILFISIFFASPLFSQSLYDLNTVQKIEIQFSQADWDYQLDVLKLNSDKYLMADWVKINGVEYDSVGVKYKGNSSYDSSFDKNPIHIELNTYKNQSHQGFVDIKLGNAYADPSMIREVLAYAILKNYMDCPLANFAEVIINGKSMGIYSNAESINKRFCSSRFYSSDNVFMKGNPNLTPGPTVKSNLKFISNDSLAYKDYYEKKSKDGWKDFVKLCDTLTNFPAKSANVMDMDRAIWMLTFNNLLINLDSYSGAFAQNYYLYKDYTNRYNPIVWDLNMAFGGFPFAGSPNNGMGTLTIGNMQQLNPFYHETHTDWPLINAVLGNATYKKMYMAHMRTMVKEIFSSKEYVTLATQFQGLIDTLVQKDSSRFFSYSQFKNGLNSNVNIGSYSVPGISTLMDARVSYIKSLTEYNYSTPEISKVSSSPLVPAYNAPVAITATITNSTSVFMGYRFDVTQKFESIPMFDDGAHNDGNANDKIFGNSITMKAANLQYYIYAENSNAGMFSPERAEHEFHQLSIPTDTIKTGDLVINEFLADNGKSDLNEYGVYSDWIEVYNTTTRTLNLTGFYLSDNVSSLKKYAFDVNTTIEPSGFLMIWADDLKTTAKYAHSGFNLSNTYGQVVISNSHNAIIDSITYGDQDEDVSLGRCPNGTGKFTRNEKPTFKASNNFFCTNSMDKNPNTAGIKVFPNPASNAIYIESQLNNLQNIEIFNLQGVCILDVKIAHKNEIIQVSEIPSGFYLYKIKNNEGQPISIGRFVISK